MNQQQAVSLRKFKAKRFLALKLHQQALGPVHKIFRRSRQANLDEFPLLIRDIDRIGIEFHELRTGVCWSPTLCQHDPDKIEAVPKIPLQNNF